jgi:serine/threonine-protein kinase RsbW
VDESNRILLERDFPTNRDELRVLPSLLERVRERCPMSDDQFFNLVIALTEAVNNAIVHGNRNDATKRVRYRVACTPDGVHCIVEDEGQGFALEEIADPVAPENLLRDGGRGLFIIRALMREVRTERLAGGMRVEFVCARTPAETR